MKRHPSDTPSRRSFLLTGSAIALSASTAAAARLDSAATNSRRPFAIDDYLNREDIIGITPDASGRAVAIQIRRSLQSGGFYAMPDWGFQPRCDIWVSDPSFKAMSKVTFGSNWFSTPVFSPDDMTLAMTMASEDGRVQLAIWETGSNLARVIAPDLDMDATATFSGSGNAPTPIVWIDPTSLLVVQRGGGYKPRPIYDLTGGQLRADAAVRSLHGKLSVRTWSTSDLRTCAPDNVLTQVDIRTGTRRPLLTGDIRGATVSPDGKNVAVVTASSHIQLVPRDRMPPVIWPLGGGYEDTFVNLDLQIIDLASGQSTGPIDGFLATQQAPSLTAPLWNSDSSILAVPARTRYTTANQGNVAYIGSIEKSGVRLQSIAATCPLDAILVAYLAAASSSYGQALERITDRPSLMGMDSEARSIGGKVTHVASTVVVADDDNIQILRVDPKANETLAGSVEAMTIASGKGEVFCVGQAEGTPFHLRVNKTGHELSKIVAEPPSTSLTALQAVNGRRICVQQTDEDTRIIVENATGGWDTTNIRLNRYFAQVIRPAERAIHYVGANGESRTGMLYLPTAKLSAGDKLPVILYAYPDSTPHADANLARPNSSGAWFLQPFLSEGFAVFHAAFPIAKSDAANEPFKLVAAEILPALDALDALPEIDKGRYGFCGHSNAGYAALALGAQTTRFKAIIAAAAFPDSFDVDLMVTPEIRMLSCAPGVVHARRLYLEAPDVPYAYAASVVSDTATFLRNSPLYNIEHYKTPTLLIYGENDVSLPAVEKMFLALQVAGVDAELDAFWGESHILQSPENIRFAVKRQVAWFKTYL